MRPRLINKLAILQNYKNKDVMINAETISLTLINYWTFDLNIKISSDFSTFIYVKSQLDLTKIIKFRFENSYNDNKTINDLKILIDNLYNDYVCEGMSCEFYDSNNKLIKPTTTTAYILALTKLHLNKKDGDYFYTNLNSQNGLFNLIDEVERETIKNYFTDYPVIKEKLYNKVYKELKKENKIK